MVINNLQKENRAAVSKMHTTSFQTGFIMLVENKLCDIIFDGASFACFFRKGQKKITMFVDFL